MIGVWHIDIFTLKSFGAPSGQKILRLLLKRNSFVTAVAHQNPRALVRQRKKGAVASRVSFGQPHPFINVSVHQRREVKQAAEQHSADQRAGLQQLRRRGGVLVRVDEAVQRAVLVGLGHDAGDLQHEVPVVHLVEEDPAVLAARRVQRAGAGHGGERDEHHEQLADRGKADEAQHVHDPLLGLAVSTEALEHLGGVAAQQALQQAVRVVERPGRVQQEDLCEEYYEVCKSAN